MCCCSLSQKASRSGDQPALALSSPQPQLCSRCPEGCELTNWSHCSRCSTDTVFSIDTLPSPPSVVRKKIFVMDFAAVGCKIHHKKRHSWQSRHAPGYQADIGCKIHHKKDIGRP